MKFRLVAATLAVALVPLTVHAEGDAAKAQTIVTQVCAACHGADGNSAAPANPSLAGQHADYLLKQLMNFKAQDGKPAERVNPVMAGMVAPLSVDDMKNLAAYYAQQKPKPRAARNADLVKQGQAIYRAGIASKGVAACSGCHSPNGAGIPSQYPRLAGQHPEYINKQLQEFKSGKRANAIMSGMVAALSPEDMKNIAAWLGQQKAKPGFAKDKQTVALGERIYRGGIADRQIAACAGCHSPNGAGIPAQYPRLSGQHADYTAAQLTAFRDGVRLNSLQMTQVASKLNDREIKAVADYIAGLR
ncbi:MAG: cytochrome c4 [Betaproteobacteria bacterium]|nr:cytochrome c4 [Betaproteobacteria bacterium]